MQYSKRLVVISVGAAAAAVAVGCATGLLMLDSGRVAAGDESAVKDAVDGRGIATPLPAREGLGEGRGVRRALQSPDLQRFHPSPKSPNLSPRGERGFELRLASNEQPANQPTSAAKEPVTEQQPPRRAGRVRVEGHSLVDDGGPFLGRGVSYFTALWRCKHDRQRLESDLAFLSKQGFNYYRMLSMVGWNDAWDGLEIAPLAFTSKAGKRVPAWPDYWQQLGELIDIAYDQYGMRTQITIFADAQFMPNKRAGIDHMNKILTQVVPGREHKIILLEVANEAWQNGFPGPRGVLDLREFARYLAKRTEIPVAITSNHADSFRKLYEKSAADIATWHFSRDKGPDDGWMPVYDCWEYGEQPGLPPVSSNEPIGPGSSVSGETEIIRMVAAAAFAHVAKLPMYVFHCKAGVMGKERFEDTPGIDRFGHLYRLLPGDVANWQRNNGKEPSAPFTAFAAGQPNRYWPDIKSSTDGCVRNIGSRKDDRFICLPIGIRPGGLQLEARENVRFCVYDPVSGERILTATKQAGEKLTLPAGQGALLIIGGVINAQKSTADRPVGADECGEPTIGAP